MILNLEKVRTFSRNCHQGHIRKSGEPYFSHVSRVYEFLKREGYPEIYLAAALLHDVVEDGHTTAFEIARRYGAELEWLVTVLSKIPRPTGQPKGIDAPQNMARIRYYLFGMLGAAVDHPEIFGVKMADQIDNLADLKSVDPESVELKCWSIRSEFLPIYERIPDVIAFSVPERQRFDRSLEKLKTTLETAELQTVSAAA